MSETMFVFWDVQHGSAAYIETPNGKHIVIDLGTGSYAENQTFSPLTRLKHGYNVQQLDSVVITHPHRDHLDDIFNFDALNPKTLWRPKHLTESEVRQGNQSRDKAIVDKYLEISSRYSAPISYDENPFVSDNNGGVNFRTFIPSECARSNLNNHSVVTIISYGDLKIIIPGDNEKPSWNELLDREDFQTAIKNTKVLVASHHGRESGFSPELFDHISPLITIISDGPVGTTCVRDRYTEKSEGWNVYNRSSRTMEYRKCLTTRNDGAITMKFRIENRKHYLDVSIN